MGGAAGGALPAGAAGAGRHGGGQPGHLGGFANIRPALVATGQPCRHGRDDNADVSTASSAAGLANPAASPARTVAAQRPDAGTPNLPPARWSAWLAVVWLLGAAGMLVRAGSQVAGAGRVRQSCRPLTEGPVPEMLAQLQQSLGLARRVRVLVTDQLASPAVAGVLLPVLILPGSLLTALTPEQLRFILLHELAHIRRGDYLVNLFQLLVEALLFFNPAVWWLSRQIRLEREACCDAVAIERSGAPTEYARTLLHVAERYVQGEPTAALAFGGRREPSGLAERIQRLLSPNHRPHLRLTWRAMAGLLLVGCGLLVLMAVGTRVTVAAILTPQERMDRIEKVLAETGEEVAPTDDSRAGDFMFTGRVRTEDGVPLPKYVLMFSDLEPSHSPPSMSYFNPANDGTFKGDCRRGFLTVEVEVPGYAPCVVGPLVVKDSNSVSGIEMVLERGFAITLQVVDADTGAPLAGARVSARFSSLDENFAGREATTDDRGEAMMTNCATLPMDLTVIVPGYETVQAIAATPVSGKPLRLAARRGTATTGLVLDKTTGQPLAGAVIQVLKQQGGIEKTYFWDFHPFVLTTSDSAGRFETAGLRADSVYQFGVGLPGHESVVFESVRAGNTNLVARLGPEPLCMAGSPANPIG